MSDPRPPRSTPTPVAGTPDRGVPEASGQQALPDDESSSHRGITGRLSRIPAGARVRLGLGVLGLVLAVVIWALGGLAPRSDSDRIDPGTPFSVGPLTLSFDKVIVVTSGSEPSWWVTGTCRYDLPSSTVVDQGIVRAARLGVRDPDTDEVTISEEPGRIEFDRYPDPSVLDRAALSPDMDAIDCMIGFTMPSGTAPTARQATLLVYDLIWAEARNTTSDSDASKTWVPGGTAHRIDLPVTGHDD